MIHDALCVRSVRLSVGDLRSADPSPEKPFLTHSITLCFGIVVTR